MQPWSQRPFEVANLLNPAFCSVLIAKSSSGYTKESKQAMPLPYAMIILPLILHKATRQSFPRRINAKLYSWILSQEELLLFAPTRIIRLRNLSQESLIFGIYNKLLRLDEQGNLLLGGISFENYLPLDDSEALDCLSKAFFLGRWLGRNLDVLTILMLLGVEV